MISLLKKAVTHFRQYGLWRTLRRIILYIPSRHRYRRFVQDLTGRDSASVFSEIYERNVWGNEESRSGIASTVANTANLRRQLPAIIRQFHVRRILDVPCGDFNWMREVPLASGLSYVGADIVPALIHRNRRKFEDAQHRFIVANILIDPLPPSDLLVCRACLPHLSYGDIRLALRNFADSGIPLLLTTTHVNDGRFANSDIQTGGWRLIDLFSEPFCFPREVLFRIEDFSTPESTQAMCLWDRTQVVDALRRLPARVNHDVS